MKKTNNKRKIIFYIINIIIVFMVSGLTIYKIIRENGIETFSHIKNMSFMSLIILTMMFFVNLYLDGVAASISMSQYKSDFTPFNGVVVQSVGGLFSAITPLKIGYLPGLGFAYSRFDVTADKVVKSMAKTSCTYEFWGLFLSAVALMVCLNREMIISIGGFELDLKYVAMIGVVYNIVLLLGCLVLMFSPTLHNILIRVLACLLYAVKKIPNKKEYVLNKIQKAEIIRKEIKTYFRDIKQFSKMFSIYVIRGLFFGALPYVIFLLVSKQEFNFELWIYTIVINDLMTYISNVIPIPGASGAVEVIFIAAFSLIFSPTTFLNSVMLIWRLFSYFAKIIVGFVIFVIAINVKKKNKDDALIQ